jgi:hypothetical protein
MVKADELIKEQNERNERKKVTYKKIYKTIEKKITFASAGDNYFILYEVPEIIFGIPIYSLNEAVSYVTKKLLKNGFTVQFYKPNKLLVGWLPKK